MAQETRAQLYAKILANLPDNTTEAITPATDRAVEDAEVESCYNLLDDDATNVTYNPGDGADWVNPDPTEVGGALDDLAGRVTTIENEPNQTAFETPYTPTTSTDWGATVPAEVRDGLDILIKKVSTNASQNIAFVSKDGSDVINEYEIGNPLKPFLTIQAAVDAVPTSNSAVIVLGGGTYTEADISLGARQNFLLDLKGCNIVGSIRTNGGGTNNMVINALGSTITNSTVGNALTMNALNSTVIGGTWINTSSGNALGTGGISGTTRKFLGCEFKNTGTGKVGNNVYESFFSVCTFKNTNNQDVLLNVGSCVFSVCTIQNSVLTSGYRAIRASNTTSVFSDCKIFGQVEVGVGNTFNMKFYNCKIKSTGVGANSATIRLLGDDYQIYAEGCEIIGGDYAVQTVTAGTVSVLQSVIKNCTLICNTDIFDENPAYTITGKKIYSINNVYSLNFTPSTINEQRIFESGKTEILGLTESPDVTI